MMNLCNSPVVVQGTQVDGESNGYGHQNPSETTIPPPPPDDEEVAVDRWALPPGWQTATSPKDGRIYYWETSTGKTSWSHPNFPGASGNSFAATTVPPAHYKPQVVTGQSNEEAHTNKIKAGVIGLLSGIVGGTGLGNWAGIPDKKTNSTTAAVGPTTGSNPNGMKTNLLDGNTNPNATVAVDGKQQQQQPEQPDDYRWLVVLAMLLCLPLGAMALYHQSRTQSAWNNGQYMRSERHSRQSRSYATYGIVIGLMLLVAWITHRRGMWEFPPGLNFDNFNFGDLFDFKR